MTALNDIKNKIKNKPRLKKFLVKSYGIVRAFLTIIRHPLGLLIKICKSCLYQSYWWKITGRKWLGLQLGGGDVRFKDFLNLDSAWSVDADVTTNFLTPLKLADNSVQIIYSSHALEHVERWEAEFVLKQCYRVLAPGGKLYIGVPDLEVLFNLHLQAIEAYKTYGGQKELDNLNLPLGIIYGGHGNKYDIHHFGYSFVSLKALLEKIGFVSITRFDHQTLPWFSGVDAASAAKINNKSVSLNIVAVK